MKKLMSLVCSLVVVVGGLSALACVNTTEAIDSSQSIKEILNNPDKYKDTTVKIQGKLIRRMAVGEQVAALVSDDESSILVLAKGSVPDVGKEVVVEGVVKTGFELEGRTVGVYIQANTLREPHFWEGITFPWEEDS